MENQFKQFHLSPNLMVMDANYRAKDASPYHVDRWSRISVVINGQLKEEAGRQEEYAQTGSLVLKPGDLLHANQFGPQSTRIVSVVVRPGFLKDTIGQEIKDWHWWHHFSTAQVALRFAQNVIEARTEQDVLEEVIDLLAVLPPVKQASVDHIPPWIARVRELVHAEYHSSLQTQQLAARVGAHPVYLARMFRRSFGCSIKTYLQRIRLQHTIQELSSSEKPLSQIALDNGFSDQSHLSRVFKRQFQHSPGGFRKWATDYQ